MSSLTCSSKSWAVDSKAQTLLLQSEEGGKLLPKLSQQDSLWKSLTFSKLTTHHRKWRVGCSSSTRTGRDGISYSHYLCRIQKYPTCIDLVCTLDKFNRLARGMVYLDQLTQRRSLGRFWHPGQLWNGWLTVLLCPWSTSALLKDAKLGVQWVIFVLGDRFCQRWTEADLVWFVRAWRHHKSSGAGSRSVTSRCLQCRKDSLSP